MSPPPVVRVEWRDSYRASDGWTSRAESIESSRAMISEPIHSAGFLIDETDAGIVVASGFNQHADDIDGGMAIPRSAIVSVTRMVPDGHGVES